MSPEFRTGARSSKHLYSYILVLSLLGGVRYAEDKVDNDGQQQDDGQKGGTEAVVKAGLAANADGFRAPVVRGQGVDHGEHGDAGEEEGADKGRAVAKVEHADGEGAKDDGEVEP